AERVLKGTPGRQGRRVKRASPVLRDLLAHQDRRALKESEGLRERLARRAVKVWCALRGPTVRPHLAEETATSKRYLRWRTMVLAEGSKSLATGKRYRDQGAR